MFQGLIVKQGGKKFFELKNKYILHIQIVKPHFAMQLDQLRVHDPYQSSDNTIHV